jgi:hypothetical protein
MELYRETAVSEMQGLYTAMNMLLNELRWVPKERTLVFRGTITYGCLPIDIIVKGERHTVEFMHNREDDSNKCSQYVIMRVQTPFLLDDGSNVLDEIGDIRLIVPWDGF